MTVEDQVRNGVDVEYVQEANVIPISTVISWNFLVARSSFQMNQASVKNIVSMSLVAQTMTVLDQMNVVAQIISVHQIVRKIFLYG
jgi:hypothetical protein